jgi:hypothetical protein
MTDNVLEMPDVHMGYARAREILRNTRDYELDTIDAAFEVLIYSPRKEDQQLCEAAVDAMWAVPRPNITIIIVVTSFMAVAAVSLIAILSELIK